MVIGSCIIELHIPAKSSLKEKRQVVKSILSRVSREFNVSIAEVGNYDLWQSATLGVVCVSNGANYVHRLLTRVVEWVERNRPDVEVIDYRIEIF
jgi:hypothetical protein